jgi:hypothetical protein
MKFVGALKSFCKSHIHPTCFWTGAPTHDCISIKKKEEEEGEKKAAEIAQ